MKLRYRIPWRLNLMSLLFVVVSLISVTLAWFAYSGLVQMGLDIGVRAWYIELEKDGVPVSNRIELVLTEIYPGMETVIDEIIIKNLGDTDAEVSYEFVSARILDKEADNYEVEGGDITSLMVEDLLAYDYPFHLHLNLSKHYVLMGGSPSVFTISLSWPLDGDDDELDSYWGREAYLFQEEEVLKHDLDSTYEPLPAIKIVINLMAQQYIETESNSDPLYNLGDEILYDVVNNRRCNSVSSSCLKTYVVDVNNLLGMEMVTLLPSLESSWVNSSYSNYEQGLISITNNWGVMSKPLGLETLLRVMGTDIKDTNLIRDSLSPYIIGNLKDEERFAWLLTKTIGGEGYYQFQVNKFPYLVPISCLWIKQEYDDDYGFCLDGEGKIKPVLKGNSCAVVPLILVPKVNLEL